MNDPVSELSHRFEIKQELGRGATAQVFLAHDNYSQHDVALKLAQPGLLDNSDECACNRKLWLNEARLAGKLQHPFIVQIFEAGNTDEFDYIVMEYVPHGTLKKYTDPANLLPLDRVSDNLYKICNAMRYANSHGVLHRDIKPANVLLGEDETVKVSDFGSAFCTESDLTQVLNVGTLAYMPPEHFQENSPTLQTDIYATGVMAYQLLAGSLPFISNSQANLIYQKLYEDPPPLEQKRQDVPASMAEVVARAMHKDMASRYRTWDEFCEDLAKSLPQVQEQSGQKLDSVLFVALRGLEFFAEFADTELWETIRICHWQEYTPGEPLVCEGDHGCSLFVIMDGVGMVTKNAVELNYMQPNDCFGEISYLDGNADIRSATVTAATPMSVIEIEGERLRQASTALQARFSRAFLKIMVDRLKNSDQRLLSWQGRKTSSAPPK